VESLVGEAAASPSGVAFRHGGISDARARTTLCLVVVVDEQVTAGVAELSAKDPDPGHAWRELRPWNTHLPEANVARARAWAARRKNDRVSWRREKVVPSDGAGLLDQILRAPKDDQLRSVYADWLSEQGDPRGELIAVQLKRALEERDGKTKAAALRKREAELWQLPQLADRYQKWLGFEWSVQLHDEGAAVAYGQGHHGADALWFHRGFVLTIQAGASKLNDLSDLIREEPVERLNIYTSGPPDGARIAAVPGLSRISHLRLLPLRAIQPDGLSLLLESRELKGLKWLELSGQSILEVGALLLAARGPEVLPSLEGLGIIDDALTPAAFSALRSTRWFRRLKWLTLDAVSLRPSAINALVSGPDVQWEALTLDRAGLSAADVLPVFTAPALKGLKRLSLRGNNLTSVAPLLATPLLGTLEQLSLNGNPLTSTAKEVLRARLNKRVVLD
jgi:uncharacterized protein (TIGR02996 family)